MTIARTALALSLTGSDLTFVVLLGCFGLICLCLFVGMLVGLWRVLERLGRPGWWAIVPVWHCWAIGSAVAPVAFGAVYAAAAAVALFLLNGLLASEIAGQIVLSGVAAFLALHVVCSFQIAREFGRGLGFTFGLVFLPFLFLPMLGFEDEYDDEFDGDVELDDGVELGDEDVDDECDVTGRMG